MPASPIHAAITPLRMIFWGGLLCLFDFRHNFVTNGSGYSVDILNDAVGVVLILVGVVKLLAIPAGPESRHRPTGKLRFVAFVTVLALFKALHGHLIYNIPIEFSAFLAAISLLSLGGMIAFCLAMQELCLGHGLRHSAREWKFTSWFFLIFYFVPLSFVYIAIEGSHLPAPLVGYKLGPEALLAFIPLMIPLVSFFLSTSSMVKEIRDLPVGNLAAESSLRNQHAGPRAAAGGLAPSGPRSPYDPVSPKLGPSPQPRRQWTVGDEPLPPKHPGVTDRVV